MYATAITILWIYYSVWMLLTPVIDSNHPVQDFFPARETGLLFTTFFAYILTAYLCTFAGIILISDRAPTDLK